MKSDQVQAVEEIYAAFGRGDFAVLDVMGGKRQAAVEIVIEVALPTGGRHRDEELHLWTFDDDGEVARLRH